MVIFCELEAEVEASQVQVKYLTILSKGIFGNMPILREGIDEI